MEYNTEDLYELDDETHEPFVTRAIDGLDLYTYTAHRYERELSIDEFEQVLDTVEENDNLVIYTTIDYDRGLSESNGGESYDVLEVGDHDQGEQPEMNQVLRFERGQIPEPYDAETVRKQVRGERNRELMNSFRIPELSRAPESGIKLLYNDPVDWLDY